ncbi:MAG TPA: protein kinase [Microbacteriaceae bacterium]
MSPSRPPSAPPSLPGFSYVELLGSGGFADVFLYRQELPSRNVAVKALLPGAVGHDEIAEFTAEANVMAQLSTHPSIVTIYQAGVSPDGRPYLVMEYCPKPNLQARYRRERISVAEAIRIGIQVAGAVETSHRAGVLHRDIKPANILVTQYNRPALTDFGIAGTTTGNTLAEAVGMSIPWSPPESFATPATSVVQSDVWALAATIYSLLAGRSPFELPGAANAQHDIMGRIQVSTLPRLGRADAPASLEHVLATAMAKPIEQRYSSALAFARALQKVEIELGFSVTAIDVLDDSEQPAGADDDDDGLTRIHAVASIEAQPHASTALRSAAASAPPAVQPSAPPLAPVDETVRRGPGESVPALPESQPGAVRISAPTLAAPAVPPVDETQRRPATTSAMMAAPTRPRRRAPLIIAAAVATVVVAGTGVAIALAGSPSHPTRPTTSAQPNDVVAAPVPAPTTLIGSASNGSVAFTWANPDPQNGDSYLWGAVVPGTDPTLAPVAQRTVVVPRAKTGQTCVEVFIRRSDGRVSDTPATECVP